MSKEPITCGRHGVYPGEFPFYTQCPFCSEIDPIKTENEKLKKLLKRCQTPLRFASMHYLDNGLLGQEHKTDCLIDAIKTALKGKP